VIVVASNVGDWAPVESAVRQSAPVGAQCLSSHVMRYVAPVSVPHLTCVDVIGALAYGLLEGAA
jgi:hypothetical protein